MCVAIYCGVCVCFRGPHGVLVVMRLEAGVAWTPWPAPSQWGWGLDEVSPSGQTVMSNTHSTYPRGPGLTPPLLLDGQRPKVRIPSFQRELPKTPTPRGQAEGCYFPAQGGEGGLGKLVLHSIREN